MPGPKITQLLALDFETGLPGCPGRARVSSTTAGAPQRQPPVHRIPRQLAPEPFAVPGGVCVETPAPVAGA